MADVNAPHAARPVDQPVAVGIVDVDAFRMRGDSPLDRVCGLEVLPGVNPTAILGTKPLSFEGQIGPRGMRRPYFHLGLPCNLSLSVIDGR